MDVLNHQTLPKNDTGHPDSPQLRIYLGIFLLAITVRLINLLSIGDLDSHANVEDSSIYFMGAKSWLESGFFSVTSEYGFSDQTERMPGYFIFLLSFVSIFENSVLPILFAQSIVDALSCVLVARLAAFVNRDLAIVSGLLAAFWYNTILHSSLILTETLFFFLLCCLLVAAAFFLQTAKLRYAYLAGLLCGLAISTRTVATLIPFAMVLLAPFVVRYHKQTFSKGLHASMAIIVISSLPLSPILHRNITQYDTLQLTSQNGVHLLNWVVGKTKAIESGRGFDVESAALNNQFAKRLSREYGNTHQLNPFQLSEERIGLAKLELKSIPTNVILESWVRGAIQNLASPAIAIDPRVRRLNNKSFYNTEGRNLVDKAYNFIEGNNKTFAAILLIGLFSSFIFSIAQLFGFFFLIRLNKFAALFGLLYVLYFLLISGPVGSAKYRIPIEPALIVFQSVFFTKIYYRLFTKA